MDSFIFSINATVPIFAMMILGNIFKRIGIIDDHFASVANRFVFKVCHAWYFWIWQTRISVIILTVNT